MNLNDVPEEMARLSRMLEQGLAALRDQSREWAEAEREYRKARALAYVQITTGTVDERKAAVDAATADMRYTRDLAEGMKQSALEAVRSRRTQISAAQSFLAASRAEAEFARTGPQ